MKHTKKETDFINHVKKVCKIYGIKCSLRNVKYVKATNNIRCAGWFEEEANSLVVAMNRPDWVTILAHEYSHLTQCIENIDIWKKGNDGCGKLDLWLSGEKVKNIKKHIDHVKYLELDNEKRSVKVIESFGLNVDIDEYIRKANSYIHFYNWIKETRKWYNPKNTPYLNKKIIKGMSSKFDMNYVSLTPEIRELFEKEKI